MGDEPVENNQKFLKRGLDNLSSPELAMYFPKGSKPFHAKPPDLRHPLPTSRPNLHSHQTVN